MPLPTPGEVLIEGQIKRRIDAEQAQIREGFLNQPVAGHDLKKERAQEQGMIRRR